MRQSHLSSAWDYEAASCRIIAIVIYTAVFAGVLFFGVIALFWYGLRGRPNEGPALGTNRPYPSGLGPLGAGSDEPPYLPTLVVSDDQEFRRSAGTRLEKRLAKRMKKRHHG